MGAAYELLGQDPDLRVGVVHGIGDHFSAGLDLAEHLAGGQTDTTEEKTEATLIIERFRNEHLPEKWVPVFEARFMLQLSQREAAAKLGMRRTTLAYQEQQIRKRLRRFLLQREER